MESYNWTEDDNGEKVCIASLPCVYSLHRFPEKWRQM